MDGNILINSENFTEQKQRAIKILQDLEFENLDPNFQMTVKQGIITGNHANDCDDCNLLHYLMAYALNQHRLETEK